MIGASFWCVNSFRPWTTEGLYEGQGFYEIEINSFLVSQYNAIHARGPTTYLTSWCNYFQLNMIFQAEFNTQVKISNLFYVQLSTFNPHEECVLSNNVIETYDLLCNSKYS